MSHAQPEKTMSHAQPEKDTKYGVVLEPAVPTGLGSAAIDGDPITIGETLEAVAVSVGNKAVDQNDADAIAAAEIRATGETTVRSGGVGETAQAAATLNSQVMRPQDKTKLSDILTGATDKLSVDKAVTKEDAEAVHVAAEMVAEPGGVAASMTTAANLNQLK
ncbi:late embryogenesis abundant protein 3 [Cajanus cajan]|nr:late embryogenesis abundant protein 3 [Cajanus cajan]